MRTAEALKGKELVCLYFSASWCGPCRNFTPSLAKFYKKAQEARPDALEVLFVSSDKDPDSFAKYFEEMPWLALPWGERRRAADMMSSFKVAGIPTLIVLDGATGTLCCSDARGHIAGGGDPLACIDRWKTMKTKAPREGAVASLVRKLATPKALVYFCMAGYMVYKGNLQLAVIIVVMMVPRLLMAQP
ncbi:unnamed protein product [Phaeothamnion confervicola]